MSRRADPSRQQEWEERFRRFEKSSRTIDEFCRAEGVSQASFYYWKKKLPGGSRRRSRVGRRRRSVRRANAGSGFRSVVITPSADRVSVKVRLPGGAVIELGEDALVIERVVGQLLEHQADARADGC